MALAKADLKLGNFHAGLRVNLNNVRPTNYLTERSRVGCAKRMQAGDLIAGEDLIASSLGQVHAAAIRNSGKGVPMEDLVQEGCIGVLRAGLSIDTRKKQPFATIASLYISLQIEDAVKAETEAFGPVQFVPNMDRLVSASSCGMKNDPREIVSVGHLNLPKCLVRIMIDEMLSGLKPREAQVIKLRFGLYGGRPLLLKEAGEILDVTNERIRQIEAKALRRLRHPIRSKKLREYLG